MWFQPFLTPTNTVSKWLHAFHSIHLCNFLIRVKKCTARWKEGTEETSNSKKSLHWFFNVLRELKSNAVSQQYSFSDTKNVCIILLKYTRELSSPGLRWITVNRQKTRNQTSTIYCSQTGKFLIFNGVTAAPCFRELNHLIWS
jgi:predicted ATP-binding protein involved in virulence